MLKARPTTYKGVEMRSRLEAAWAWRFDQLGFDWTYEPNRFAGDGGTYLVDFRLDHGGRHTFVEIKPPLALDELATAMRRMAIIWESEPDATLWLIRLGPDDGWTIHLGREGAWETVGPELMFSYQSSPDHVSRSLPGPT